MHNLHSVANIYKKTYKITFFDKIIQILHLCYKNQKILIKRDEFRKQTKKLVHHKNQHQFYIRILFYMKMTLKSREFS